LRHEALHLNSEFPYEKFVHLEFVLYIQNTATEIPDLFCTLSGNLHTPPASIAESVTLSQSSKRENKDVGETAPGQDQYPGDEGIVTGKEGEDHSKLGTPPSPTTDG
jgi:hypothetical protein